MLDYLRQLLPGLLINYKLRQKEIVHGPLRVWFLGLLSTGQVLVPIRVIFHIPSEVTIHLGFGTVKYGFLIRWVKFLRGKLVRLTVWEWLE